MNVFMGQSEVVLEELWNNGIPIDIVITEDKPSNSKVVEFCKKQNIPVYIIKNYKDIQKILHKYDNLEYCFVASFGIILKSDTIKKFKKYIINFHAGDVFKCRGRHPLPASILHNYPEMGITVHLIEDEKIDAGPILYRLLMPIDYDASYKFNEKRLTNGLRCLASLVANDVKQGNIITYRWDIKQSIYFKPLKKEILKKIIESKRLRDIKNEKSGD